MIDDATVALVRSAAHGDPFSVLGLHADGEGQTWLRAFLPGAASVAPSIFSTSAPCRWC